MLLITCCLCSIENVESFLYALLCPEYPTKVEYLFLKHPKEDIERVTRSHAKEPLQLTLPLVPDISVRKSHITVDDFSN